jgi:O-antigen ligase
MVNQGVTQNTSAVKMAISLYQHYQSCAPHIFAIFLAGFLFAPAAASHNAFFYLFLLAPLLGVIGEETYQLARTNWLARLSFLFILYMCLSSIWNSAFTAEDIGRSFKHGFITIGFISLSTWLQKNHQKALIQWFSLAPIIITVGAALATVIWYQDHSFPNSRLFGWGRMDYPPHLSAIAAFGIIAAFSQFSTVTRGLKISYILSILALGLFIILTQSTLGAWAVCIAASAFLVVPRLQIMLVIGTTVGILVLISLLQPSLLQPIVENVGGSARLEIWQHIIGLLQPSWLIGHGLKADFNYLYFDAIQNLNFNFNRTHNVYLASLYYGGVIGFALNIMVSFFALLVLFIKALRDKKAGPLALMLLGSALIGGDWSHIIDHPDLPYLIYWLPLSVAIFYTPQLRITKNSRTM